MTLQTNAGMASTLLYHQTIFRDRRYLLRLQKSIEGMTSADLQRARQKILVPENETFAYIVKKAPAKPAAQGNPQ